MIEREDSNNDGKIGAFERFRIRFMRTLDRLFPYKKPAAILYLIVITLLAVVFINFIGKDVFPKVNSSQFQLRMRAPDGTRLERTEEKSNHSFERITKNGG